MSYTTASLKAFPPSALALACLHALAGPLPTGADIRQGSGTIATTGSGLEIRQTSQKLVTDWQTFDIGAGQRVEFIQPGRDSVALNRVIGGSPTEILGQLKANGRVYIENAAGVLFAPGAQVDVGSLVATSLHVDPDSLDGGRLRLGGDASAGAVINQGRIQTAGGDVILAGPRVANAGDIVAPNGRVALAAGSAMSIDPSGTGLLSVQVTGAALQARVDAGGRIEAAAVTLAAAARDAVMRVDGTLRARTAENRGGTIVLSGGAGAVDVAGTLDASGGSGSPGGQSGGTVQVLGDRIALRDSARIDVSGATGGGTVRIGGDARGLGSLQHASTTDIARGAVIDASATQHGQGGSVAVWSDQTTRDAGTILARGGTSGGDGGQVEISSAGRLDLAGVAKIDTTAAHGRRGQLLLDPESLEIVDDSQQDVNGDGTGDPLSGPSLPYGAPGNPSRVGAGQVARLLNSTDVTLQANDRLDVLAPITVAAAGPATTLTLNGTIINVEAPITLNNSALVAQTPLSSDAIRVDAAITSLTSVALISTDIQLNADVTAPHVLLSSGDDSGNVNQFAGRVVADDLDIHMRWGAVHMGDSDNVASRVDIEADMATLQAHAPGGSLALSGDVYDDFAFTTAGSVAQTRPLTVGGAFTLIAGGSARLTDAGNDFNTVAFTSGGALSLNDANDLTASGVAGGNVLLTAAGLFSTGGSLQTTGAGATLDIRSAGFDNSGNGGSNALLVQPDGRFFIRSSDYTRDQLGSLAFSANGGGDVNYTILGGWRGADPTGGNGYYTNRTGTIAAPAGDRPGISRVYDGTTGFDFSQSGHSASADLDGGVNASLGDYSVRSHGAFDDKNAGSGKGYTVAASDDVTARAADGSAVYGLHYGGYTRAAGNVGPLSEITPRALVSTGITGVDRAYDGTTSVGLNLGGASLNQVVAGDDVHLGATGTMADKNVGSGKPVGVTASLSGADAANYTVTDASTATVTITPRALVSTGITGVDRVYDGTTSVGLNLGGASLNQVVAGDDVHLGATGTMADKNVGSGKPVGVTASLSGADAANYTVSDASGATVTITPRALVSTGITGVDRVYDGTTSVGLNLGSASLNQVVAGDDVHLGATGTMADKNVGSGKSVGVTASLSGADAANYTVTDASGATVTITPRALVSTGITGVDRGYDGTTGVGLNLGGASLNRVVTGDDVRLSATGSLADKDVGTSKTVSVTARLSGADAANYTVTDASGATATVTPRVLTVTGLGTVDRETDGTRNVTLRTGGAGLGGVIGGDSVQLDSAGARGQSATSVAGEQTVSVSNLSLDGRDAKDYVLQSPTLTVDLHAPFERLRYHEYQQAIVDAQEPFRRQQLEVFLSGFGKENIRKPLRSGQVFETGYAPPAIDDLEGARPVQCPPLPARCKRDEAADAAGRADTDDIAGRVDAAGRTPAAAQGPRP